MSVAIRLKMMGTKNAPCYRIVALDNRKTRDGRALANLGHYNPRTEPATVVLDEERLLTFLNTGAQPSETVASLLRQHGIERGAKGWAKKA